MAVRGPWCTGLLATSPSLPCTNLWPQSLPYTSPLFGDMLEAPAVNGDQRCCFIVLFSSHCFCFLLNLRFSFLFLSPFSFSFDPSRHPLIHFYPLIDMPFDIYLFTLQTGTTCFSSDSPHWLHPPQNTPLSSITAANLLSPLSSPVSLPLLFSSPYSATERILCWSVFSDFLIRYQD